MNIIVLKVVTTAFRYEEMKHEEIFLFFGGGGALFFHFPKGSLNPLSLKSRSKTNFSFQFIASYVWYSMENLAGDLWLWLKFVKLSILPTLFIHFV